MRDYSMLVTGQPPGAGREEYTAIQDMRQQDIFCLFIAAFVNLAIFY